jgi:hypothetical protein
MRALFNSLRQEVNCGAISDSYSSNSQPRMDINNYPNPMSFLCEDEFSLSGDPELALKCRNSGYQRGQSHVVQPQQTYPNNVDHRFLSYQDYVRRMGSVNANPNTLMMTHDYDNEYLGSPHGEPIVGSPQDSREQITRDLKNYVKDFQLASPQEVEEPKKSDDKSFENIRGKIQTLLDRFKTGKS